MSKFKVGDKVVIISKHLDEYRALKLGESFIIDDISPSLCAYSRKNLPVWYFEENLVLESIYNSTLYKALNEDEE